MQAVGSRLGGKKKMQNDGEINRSPSHANRVINDRLEIEITGEQLAPGGGYAYMCDRAEKCFSRGRGAGGRRAEGGVGSPSSQIQRPIYNV